MRGSSSAKCHRSGKPIVRTTLFRPVALPVSVGCGEVVTTEVAERLVEVVVSHAGQNFLQEGGVRSV